MRIDLLLKTVREIAVDTALTETLKIIIIQELFKSYRAYIND
jgi:hypothetical protein